VLPYLAPEQALGEPVDHRADIFSIGGVLYTMLTGEAPFKGPTAAATVLAVLQVTPGPPSARNPAVPSVVDAVVSRALAKNLEGRYQSAAELAADLRGAADLLERRTASEAEPTQAPVPRRRTAALIILLIVVLVLVAAGWFLRGRL
jgi:serine/threonine-protein kinase